MGFRKGTDAIGLKGLRGLLLAYVPKVSLPKDLRVWGWLVAIHLESDILLFIRHPDGRTVLIQNLTSSLANVFTSTVSSGSPDNQLGGNDCPKYRQFLNTRKSGQPRVGLLLEELFPPPGLEIESRSKNE